jgi:hypothetical protein
MGWNEAYTILESAVISAYDLGKLDETLLRALMEKYRNSDIDHGGSADLQAKDGLNCDEIIVKILRPDVWATAKDREYEYRYEIVSDAWYELTRKEFGYW